MTLIARIEGYAAVFHERDLNGDIVAPGAFAKSLKRRAAPVRMLYQHAAETPVGRWTSLAEDAKGLFVKGELILSSDRAREVHALLEGGALDGFSIGYQTVRAKKSGPGRTILEADLWEVSIVTFPMAPSARVTHVGAPQPHRDLTDPRRALALGAQAGGRAPLPQGGARHFADVLKSAASILSV